MVKDKDVIEYFIGRCKVDRKRLEDHPGATSIAFMFKGQYCEAYRDSQKKWARIVVNNKLIVFNGIK